MLFYLSSAFKRAQSRDRPGLLMKLFTGSPGLFYFQDGVSTLFRRQIQAPLLYQYSDRCTPLPVRRSGRRFFLSQGNNLERTIWGFKKYKSKKKEEEEQKKEGNKHKEKKEEKI